MIPRPEPPSSGDLVPPFGRKSTIVVVGATVLGILFFYLGNQPTYLRYLAASVVLWRDPAFTAGLYSFAAAFVLLGLIPALIVKFVLHEPLSAYGVQLGDLSFGWKAFAVVAPVMALLSLSASRMPEFLAVYPLNRAAGAGPLAFGGHALAYLAFYAGWEFGFRGFVQFGLREEIGDWNAILVQTAVSAAFHVGKPFGETLGAVLGGLVWGVIAFRSRSLLVPLLTHWVLGLSLDLFIVCR